MKRKLETLANGRYDLVVIGGGIYGACIVWDAVLRGLRVCLIEKGDFGAATSANSMKIIHGGLRQLQDGNIKRARELILERRTWMRVAPHLVHPLPVVIPLYDSSLWMKRMLAAALLLNDLIGLDRNRRQDPQTYIPRGRAISQKECLELLPDIPSEGLTGGAVFYDAQVYNTERLVLSILASANERGADIANYVEAVRVLKENNHVCAVQVTDRRSDNQFLIQAAAVVNSCGPGIERLMESIGPSREKVTGTYAKAINLVTRRLFRNCAVGIRGSNGYLDRDRIIPTNSHFLFVAPWRDRSLVGTRYMPYESTPEKFQVTEEEVQVFLDEVNASRFGARLTMEDVSFVHAGLLPMRNRTAGRCVELHKQWKIIDHSDSGIEGFLTVQGAKYTTARLAAEKVVDKVLEKRGHTPKKSLTSVTPIHGGEIADFDGFVRFELRKNGQNLEESTFRHLLYNHGSAYAGVLRYLDSDHIEKTITGSEVLKAEVINGIREEMACTLSDVVFRRTDLGTAGHPGTEALRICAELVSAELGWSPDRTQAEIETTNRAFRIVSR